MICSIDVYLLIHTHPQRIFVHWLIENALLIKLVAIRTILEDIETIDE